MNTVTKRQSTQIGSFEGFNFDTTYPVIGAVAGLAVLLVPMKTGLVASAATVVVGSAFAGFLPKDYPSKNIPLAAGASGLLISLARRLAR